MAKLEDEVEKYKSTKWAEAKLQKDQIPKHRSPTEKEKEDVESFPDGDVTGLSDEQLMHYYGLFNAFHAYALNLLSQADIERTAAERIYDFTLEQVSFQAPPTCKNATEKKMYAKTVVIVREAEYERLRRDAYYTLLKGMVQGYEKKANFCSREVSRRQGAQMHLRSQI